MTLYEISDRLMQIYGMAESGEYDPQAIDDTLEAIEWELEEKADGCAKFITSLKGEIEALRAEEKRLLNRRKAKEAFAEYLKANLEAAMKYTGKRQIKTLLYSFNIQKNPPSVYITDWAAVPEKYLIEQEPLLDKAGIKEAFKNGGIVPGVELVQSESLRIR
jgi:hypothetical protein